VELRAGGVNLAQDGLGRGDAADVAGVERFRAHERSEL